MTEILNYVIPIAGGITLGSVLLFIGSLVMKASVSKLINKVNTEKITEKAVERGVETVKSTHFTYNIDPIAKAELEKVGEEANAIWKEKAQFFEKKFYALVDILEIFTEYFDNSIGVPEDKKTELKEAFLRIRETAVSTPEIAPLDIVVEKEENTAETGNKTVKVGVIR